MPMPALNIMAIHETVRNSGASSSRPRGIRPYLLAASHSTKTTKAEARVTNSQPRFSSIQTSAEPLAEPRPVGLRKPHATNARARTAETANTPRSSRPFSSATGGGGAARAGCSSVCGPETDPVGAGAVAAAGSWGPGRAVGVIVTGGCCARAGAPPFRVRGDEILVPVDVVCARPARPDDDSRVVRNGRVRTVTSAIAGSVGASRDRKRDVARPGRACSRSPVRPGVGGYSGDPTGVVTANAVDAGTRAGTGWSGVDAPIGAGRGSRMRVAIIGAGPAGLFIGSALAGRGHEVIAVD